MELALADFGTWTPLTVYQKILQCRGLLCKATQLTNIMAFLKWSLAKGTGRLDSSPRRKGLYSFSLTCQGRKLKTFLAVRQGFFFPAEWVSCKESAVAAYFKKGPLQTNLLGLLLSECSSPIFCLLSCPFFLDMKLPPSLDLIRIFFQLCILPATSFFFSFPSHHGSPNKKHTI